MRDECKKLVEITQSNPKNEGKFELDIRPEKYVELYRKCEIEVLGELQKVAEVVATHFNKIDKSVEKSAIVLP